ncbi:efflux RND transporter periplasmic adaptor subunit [Bordetella genomosp. 12]|uniref:Efflux transporter periplasmic adaptor subunit n=1 Tax=Bordetella genomosp. 12 TaxID=463035 RepID=A0A261VEH4_9BORD|nr:efflux RND transporter periplasmic adaptor subunit [Bordetella genomosp. 12]OZI71980.1 hypothetical protein CAL22_19570 [Bordetella genomosp. 12]
MAFSLTAGPRRWLAALLILAALAFWAQRDEALSAAAPAAQQAVPVEVVLARAAPLRLQLHAIGTVTPLAHIVLRPQVSGLLMRLHYREGQVVQAGQLLAEIDSRPYQHALNAALGKADQTRARLDNARADLARYTALSRQDAVARSQLDAARSAVEHDAGQLAADQAGVDEARRQLALTRITAPVSGRIGLRRIDAGNHVRANDTQGLATLVQTGATSVLFDISEARLPLLREAMANADTLAVEAWDADDRRLVARGTLQALDNRTGNGSVRLRASFANEQEQLFPYQFVNIRLTLQQQDHTLTIPAAAVQYGAQGPYAYVIDNEGKARRKPLEIGLNTGGRAAILAGLADGERVVIEGVDRLNEGRAAKILAIQEDL